MTYFPLRNIKDDILNNVGNQAVSVLIGFHCMYKKDNRNRNWLPCKIIK